MSFFVARVREEKKNKHSVLSFKLNETDWNMTTYASENVNCNF
jgi:hypothetical protein